MPKRIPFSKPAQLPGQRVARYESKSERDRFYSGTRWRKLREAFLLENPLCAQCTREGRVIAAAVVHHLVERLEDPDRAYEWENLESSCNPCHTRRHKQK